MSPARPKPSTNGDHINITWKRDPRTSLRKQCKSCKRKNNDNNVLYLDDHRVSVTEKQRLGHGTDKAWFLDQSCVRSQMGRGRHDEDARGRDDESEGLENQGGQVIAAFITDRKARPLTSVEPGALHHDQELTHGPGPKRVANG
jgi:hypothetical protein